MLQQNGGFLPDALFGLGPQGVERAFEADGFLLLLFTRHFLLLFVALILFLVDAAAQRVHAAAYVPAVAVLDLFTHVVEHPLAHVGPLGEVLHDAVNSPRHHLVAVELHAQPRCQSQLMGQRAQNTLEEGVDGLHSEVAVIVQDGAERLLGTLAQLAWFQADALSGKAFLHLAEHTLVAVQVIAQGVE